MTGMARAKAERRSAVQTSGHVARRVRAPYPILRQTRWTVTDIARAMRIPGTMPATKSLPTEVFAIDA